MPFESKAQSRWARWTVAHPALASARGEVKAAQEFIDASHGQKVRDLPERVQHKAEGGRADCPKPFRW